MPRVQRVRRLENNCCNEKAETGAHEILKDMKKRPYNLSEKNDWEDATCPICLEYPHNSVLLLCSSYNKGCRPYMCGTSYRLSNCFDRYHEAYRKANQGTKTPCVELGRFTEKASEPLCPLCRGQVKGWTLVESAQKHLDKKKRTCMHEKCSFVGNCKELKNHVKLEHPRARPREVDQLREEKWKSLENERALNDVISTFAPGAVVVGDYVLDYGFGDYDTQIENFSEDDFGTFTRNTIGRPGLFHLRITPETGYESYDDNDEDDNDDYDSDDISIIPRQSTFSRNVGRDVGPTNHHHRSNRRWRQ